VSPLGAAGYPKRCSVQAWPKTSESTGGSRLSGEAWSVPAWPQMSESVGGSQMSREAMWIAFTPADDRPVEHGVVPQLQRIPVGLLALLC
jgi:hypothetical protein